MLKVTPVKNTPGTYVFNWNDTTAATTMTTAQLANACELQLGELFTREKLHSGIDRMRLLLQENGYYAATIREGLEPDPATQQVNITLYVKSGVQASRSGLKTWKE